MANNHPEIENRLLTSIDKLRANSNLMSSEYFVLVLGLIFLRYIDLQFSIAEKELAGDGSGHRTIDKNEFRSRAVIYVPPKARFSNLLNRQGENIGEAINEAMELVEAENHVLSDVLPKTYHRIGDYVLVGLLKSLSTIVDDVERDSLVKVYETILGTFSRAIRHLHTPKEIATLLVELVKPRNGMSVYDPCAGMGSVLLEARHFVTRTSAAAIELRLYGQEVQASIGAICKMHLLINGVCDADIRLGNTLTDPQHTAHGELMQFDCAVANVPFGVSWHSGEAENDRYGRFRYGATRRSYVHFAFIQHMIASVTPKGTMAIVVPHCVLFQEGTEGRIRQWMLEDDLIEAVIGLPPGLFYETGLSAAVLVINKNKSPERSGKVLFINADREFEKAGRQNHLRPEDLSRIVATFESFSSIERYSRVVCLDEIRSNSFNLNISRYADSSPLVGLVTQYSQFAKYAIEDIAVEFKTVSGKGRFEEKANAVYIPMIGNKRATHSLDDLESRHDVYCQVVLNGQALNEYVAHFLSTSVGQHALSLLAQGSVAGRLRKADLGECIIALPSPEIQQDIICTHHKLAALKDAIAKLEHELSLNPTGQSEFRTQVESLLAVINGLSDADYVRSNIRQGESKTVEFKQAFSLDVEKSTKEKYIETSALKTLAAFLNSDGGTLLVGVRDDEKIVGVDVEIKKFHKDSLDNFLKHFKNCLKSRIGEAFYPFINYRIVDVDRCRVLVVECIPSKSPCFLDQNDFYVRTNPATDKLEGPKFLEYVKHRFQS